MTCICCNSNQLIPQLISSRDYLECLHCGFIFSAERLNNKLKSRVTDHYQNIDPHERVANSKRSFFKSTLNYLSSEIKNKDKSILDIGCGFGYFLELASRAGWNTFGVEIVDAAVKTAREKVGETRIFHGFLKDAYYSDECFDVITLWDVLVMFDTPFGELKECYRILKQRGKIGIRVRNALFQKMTYKIYLPFRNVASWLDIKKPYVFHQSNFGEKSLRLLLQKVGFKNIQITNSPLTEGDPYSLTQIEELTSFIKFAVCKVAGVIFEITKGRILIGPSLLVWAEKL